MAVDTKQYKIFGELAELKSNYEGTSLEKVGGLTRSQHQIIKMCEYYSDSRYLGVYLGNRKEIAGGHIDIPFYNIVNYRVALAKTATDLDIKDIQVVSDNPKYQVHSMLLNREAYEWMKKEEFSKTLNQMGYTRPKYGGYLVKKTETDGDLHIDVVRWTNVYTDQNDILAGPIVECHHMSPVALKKKDKVWDNVIDVLKTHQKIKAKDRPTVIEVYEVTGEYPISVFNDSQEKESTEEDKYTYSLQRYFIADIDGKKYCMDAQEISGELTDYYEYLTWEDNGYGLGRGVIEDSEEAQVWTNDAVINESIAMSLAGRAGIITNSKKIGNNILTHDHGKIYEIEENKTATAFNIVPAALGQYQNQIEKWRAQADNITSSFNAITGEQPPSGTPYSQTALLNQVATKPFDYKREEWGIHLTKIFDKWVIPYLIKKIKKEHILVSEFSETELENIDESFAYSNSNKDIKEALLRGELTTPEQQEGQIEGYKQHIKKSGKKRFIKIPEDYFKDIECKVTVITTGEQKNKAAVLQSLSTILGDVLKFYQLGIIQDPKFIEQIFKEIIENSGSGISPTSLGKIGQMTQQTPQAPGGATPSPVAPQMNQPLMNK